MRFLAEQRNNIYPEIPNDYVVLEYIQSTGTQYIDTEYDLNSSNYLTTRFCERTSYQGESTKGWYHVNGAGGGSSMGYYVGFANKSSNYMQAYGNGYADIKTTVQASYNTIYQYDLQLNSHYIVKDDSGNVLVNITPTTQEPTSHGTLYLFGVRTMTTPLDSYAQQKLYYAKLYDNGTLVRYYIPVKNTISNEVGMYDIVNRKFHGNQGTGTFIAGDEIKKVEYLESDGASYIDTGIIPSLSTTDIEFTCNDYETNGYGCQFGAYSNELNYYTLYNQNKLNVNLRFGSVQSTTAKEVADVFNVIAYKNKNIYFDGELVGTNTYTGSLTHSVPLFARWTSTEYTYYSNKLKMSYCKIWDSNVLVRDFIPVLYGTTYAMYDTVNSKVYTNSGTGTFTGGDVSAPTNRLRLVYNQDINSGYERLEYLESTGTQYIDMGIKGKSGIDFDYKVNFPTSPNGSAIGGEYAVGSSLYLGLVRTNGKLAYHYGTTTEPTEITSITTNTDYTIVGHMWSGSQYVTVNGTNYTVGTYSGTFTSSYNMYLFANNYQNAISSPTKAKIYYCKIYDNSTLVRNFIPMKRKFDGVLGMYDTVTQTFYTNVGTGTFTAGPAIEQIDYIESFGAQYFDTGIRAKTGVSAKLGFIWKDDSIGNDNYVLGASSTTRLYFGTYQGRWQYGYGNFYQADGIQENVYYEGEVSWRSGNQYVRLNNTTFISQILTDSIDIGWNLTMFARKTSASGVAYYSKIKMYYCQLYENDVLVRDFIPVKLTSTDGSTEYAMFDKLNAKVYRNEGSGAFSGSTHVKTTGMKSLYSENKLKLPAGYTLKEYLKASGTQYINTNYYPNNTTSYEVKCIQPQNAVIGVARWSGDPTYDTFGAHAAGPSPMDYYGRYSTNHYKTYTTSQFSHLITWKHTPTNINIVGSDGTVYANDSITTDTFTSTYPMWVFAFNNMGTILSRNVGSTIYYFKIWDGNTLVRDFVPAMRDSDSVLGMYDIVNNKFYTNAGTGTFTCND